MWRTFLLAACAAPATALPFGFGRRKGEVLASLHEIEADLADLETETTNPVPQTVPVGADHRRADGRHLFYWRDPADGRRLDQLSAPSDVACDYRRLLCKPYLHS